MLETPGIRRFTLTDASGTSHDYIVQEHPAGEGMEIMFLLLGLGAPSLVGVIGTAIKSADLLRALFGAVFATDDAEGDGAPKTVGGALAKIDGADWSTLLDLLKDVDLSTVGIEVGRALSTGRAPELTRKILSKTHRDGQALGEKNGAFERAYQANYWELLQAVWKVCTINRFFPVSLGSAGSLGGA